MHWQLLLAAIALSACDRAQFKSTGVSDPQPAAAEVSSDDQVAISPTPVTETIPDTVIETVPAVVTETPGIFKECNGNTTLPFIADLYQLVPNTKLLPDFTTMKAIKEICMQQLDITNRDFKEGFPGVEGLIEWFALGIRTKLLVPKDGAYTFTLNSDDGSKLYIDGTLLINDDGVHASKELSGTKTLTAGTHDLRVEYFQGPRYHIALELFWLAPNATARQYIPVANLKRP